MRRFIQVFLLLLVGAGSAWAAPEPKLVLVSWDGAADWVVDRLLAEGALPNLARLAAAGAAADYSVTSFPSKTAAGHAVVWTGAWPATTGVPDNWLHYPPESGRSLLEVRRGFSSEVLAAEPLYVTAAKAGKRVVVLSATQSYPPAPHLATLSQAGVPPERYRSVSGFEHRLARSAIYGVEGGQEPDRRWERRLRRRGWFQLAFEVAGTPFFAFAYDDPGDPTRGLDRLLIRQGSPSAGEATAEAVLVPRAAAEVSPGNRPAGWSPPFEVCDGERCANTFFRLFSLAADGSELTLYQRQASALDGAMSEGERAAYRDAYPGFHDPPFGRYAEGALGTPLPEGGDGTAERRVLELVAFEVAQQIDGTRFALARWKPDVLLHYSPLSDDAGHTLMGLLDPASPAHDPEAAAAIWPFYTAVFRHLDAWLGAILDTAPPETIVALVSDHGMAGCGRYLFTNRVMARAGLLRYDAQGRIDLARTKVLATPASDFALWVNDRGRAGGIVDPGEREAVLAAAADALLAVRDPATGHAVVERVFRPERMPGLGLAGPLTGDLYFDLAPGYYPRRFFPELPADQGGLVGPVRRAWGQGEHGFWPERRDMHAIFYLGGPGVRAGVTAPPIRHIDIAPTLARLLGMPAPPQAEGHVIEALLEP